MVSSFCPTTPEAKEGNALQVQQSGLRRFAGASDGGS